MNKKINVQMVRSPLIQPHHMPHLNQFSPQIPSFLGVSTFSLTAHGDEFGYDETRMASYGASAGGHLSALAGIALAADPAAYGPLARPEVSAREARLLVG